MAPSHAGLILIDNWHECALLLAMIWEAVLLLFLNTKPVLILLFYPENLFYPQVLKAKREFILRSSWVATLLLSSYSLRFTV